MKYIIENIFSQTENLANQIVINLDVGQYLIWYYLLAIGIASLSLWATIRHKTLTPFFWGLSLSLIIIMLQAYLTPVLFGFMAYDWVAQPVLWTLTTAFAVMWFGFIALALYNSIRYGKVIM